VLLLHGHAHELRQDFGNVHNQMLQQRKGKKNADCANTIGMDLERMLFFVVHHPMDAETHNIPPGEEVKRLFSGYQMLECTCTNGNNEERGILVLLREESRYTMHMCSRRSSMRHTQMSRCKRDWKY